MHPVPKADQLSQSNPTISKKSAMKKSCLNICQIASYLNYFGTALKIVFRNLFVEGPFVKHDQVSSYILCHPTSDYLISLGCYSMGQWP
jgi:hypothetical protein